MSSSKKSLLYPCAAFVIVVWGAYEAQAFLMPMCLAALITFFMTPVARLLRRLKFPEFACVTLSAFILLVPLGLAAYLMISQVQSLAQDWPQLYASLRKIAGEIQQSPLADRLHFSHTLSFDALASRLSQNLGSEFDVAIGSVERILSASSFSILIIFFSVMMLSAREHIKRSFEILFAEYSELQSASMIVRMVALIETFLLVRMGIAVAVAIFSFVVLLLFGVPYSFVLAVVFGFMTWFRQSA